ncbi:MAG: hypothetical protein K6G09_04590 [Treponema sp.]|nr:hypothetical protein [Treponema sp.]
MIRKTMILKMQGYWAVGSGKGGGNEVDNRIDRDADGLPYVPGKMLKGLIRDACQRLQSAGNEAYNFVDEVFGKKGSGGDENGEGDGLSRTATEKGKIYISDARLPANLRAALSKEDNQAAKDNITRNIYSTAINENGIAKDKSLRGYEVTVPMQLESILECDCDEETFEYIKKACKLVYAVGSHKSRGLGEVVIEFKDVNTKNTGSEA